MKINSEDPRLTAYALGELDQNEVEEFEQLLDKNSELKSEIDSIKGAIDSLKQEFDNLPKEELSDEQKQSLLSRKNIIITRPSTFSKISRWTGISAAAACFIGMGIIGYDSIKKETDQESINFTTVLDTETLPVPFVFLDAILNNGSSQLPGSNLSFDLALSILII